MQTLTEALWALDPPGGLFDEAVVAVCFPAATPAARRNLLYRATLAGEVSILRRGLYALSPAVGRTPIDPLALPSLIYGPSYVSFETALRFHGLIPDLVQTVAAGTARRSSVFDTPRGRFEFLRVPVRTLMAGVHTESFDPGGRIVGPVASPARALADLVYVRKEVAGATDLERLLHESWRIELDDLAAAIVPQDLEETLATWRHARVRRFLEGLRSLLGHPSPPHPAPGPERKVPCA